jgi:hypothetical protein
VAVVVHTHVRGPAPLQMREEFERVRRQREQEIIERRTNQRVCCVL